MVRGAVMIADLKPYAEYKESGLPQLGRVPVHWSHLRAKYLFREVDERSATGREELLSVSHLTGVTPRSQKTITMFLAKQIQTTIKQFMQVGATVGHADRSGDLRKFIEQGKKIIVSTVQKFPFILDEIATEGGKTFAIVIDEAHSSQGGKTSAAMSEALGGALEGEDTGADAEDTVNEALERRMAARKMLTNASYFAFTATPKNKTLEMFGEPL